MRTTLAGDDVALLEVREGGVVVGDDLAVDLEQQAVGAFDDLGVGGVGGFSGQWWTCSGNSLAAASVVDSAAMPVRATKRGAERTPLTATHDVLICGASFAGLAVARELAGSGARVLVVDRYEIGERQTSACAAPTAWLRNLGLARRRSARRSASSSCTRRAAHVPLAAAVHVLDVRLPRRCARCWPRRATSTFETAKVEEPRRRDARAHRPRRRCARRWSSTRSAGAACSARDGATSSRPRRCSRAAWRSTPTAPAHDLELWLDRRYVRAGLRLELPGRRRAARRRRLVRPARPRQGPDAAARRRRRRRRRALPGQLDPPRAAPRGRGRRRSSPATAPATACPPPPRASAPALYFGLACGRELRAVVEGRRRASEALARYARVLGRARAGSSGAAPRAAGSSATSSRARALMRAVPARAAAARRAALGLRAATWRRAARVRARRTPRAHAEPRGCLEAAPLAGLDRRAGRARRPCRDGVPRMPRVGERQRGEDRPSRRAAAAGLTLPTTMKNANSATKQIAATQKASRIAARRRAQALGGCGRSERASVLASRISGARRPRADRNSIRRRTTAAGGRLLETSETLRFTRAGSSASP